MKMCVREMKSQIILAINKMLRALTFHPHLHAPEHVGPFAGSLLKRSDWDHD
jgi:hypothetical protein